MRAPNAVMNTGFMALRGVLDGGASAGDIWVVLGAAAVLTAVFAPLTVRLYRNRN